MLKESRGWTATHIGCCMTIVLGACADQQAPTTVIEHQVASEMSTDSSTAPAGNSKDSDAMQRVIVNLAPSEKPVSDQIAQLTQKYPQAKTVRVLSAFRQVVLEVPESNLKALEREPEVQQLALDGRTNTAN